MKRLLAAGMAVFLCVLALGCGSSERDRGKNSQLDRPKAATPATAQQ